MTFKGPFQPNLFYDSLILALMSQLTAKFLVKSHLGASANVGLRINVPIIPLGHLREGPGTEM